MKWPDWTGAHVACVGTGPSLTAQQLEAVRVSGAKVIAINDAGIPGRLPFSAGEWCDLWYAADLNFWNRYASSLALSSALRVAAQPQAVKLNLAHLYLDTKSGGVGAGFALSGGHSGFQALQIALTAGASLVSLHGYDCRPGAIGTNYFGNKPSGLAQSSPYERWIEGYRTLDVKSGRVLNCTPGSAIDAFEFGNYWSSL